jgi:hypothetical protein
VTKPEQASALKQAIGLVAIVLASLPPEKVRGSDQLRAAMMDAVDALDAAVLDLETSKDEP